MPTPLNDQSRVIKAVASHLETGIPIDRYNLTEAEHSRIRAVFHLFSVWSNNPLIDKREFLKCVHHRRTADLPNDLYVFDYIRAQSASLMSKQDLMLIRQRATLSALQAAEQTGDLQAQLKAAKLINDIIKDMPEQEEVIQQDLPDFYTTDIKAIAKDFIPVDSENRRKYLAKYGGTPDHNTQLVEDKVAALLNPSL